MVNAPVKGPHPWFQAIRLLDFAVVSFPESRLVELVGKQEPVEATETNEQPKPTDESGAAAQV